MEADQIVAYAWIAIAVYAGIYFWFGRDVTNKRLHFRYYLVAIAVAFGAAALWLGVAWWQLLIATPVVAGITWYNLHSQRFCSHCGKPVDEEREPLIIGLQECCRRCHAPLEPRGVFGRRTVGLFRSRESAEVASARLAAHGVKSVALPTPSEFTDGRDLIQLQVEAAVEMRARQILEEGRLVDPSNRT